LVEAILDEPKDDRKEKNLMERVIIVAGVSNRILL